MNLDFKMSVMGKRGFKGLAVGNNGLRTQACCIIRRGYAGGPMKGFNPMCHRRSPEQDGQSAKSTLIQLLPGRNS